MLGHPDLYIYMKLSSLLFSRTLPKKMEMFLSNAWCLVLFLITANK